MGERKAAYKEDGALAWVQHSQGLVLAGGEDPGAVPVPAGVVDEVRVHAVDPHHRLSSSHVPQDHHVITGWWSRSTALTGGSGFKTPLFTRNDCRLELFLTEWVLIHLCFYKPV